MMTPITGARKKIKKPMKAAKRLPRYESTAVITNARG
jgi:hypothetical protein